MASLTSVEVRLVFLFKYIPCEKYNSSRSKKALHELLEPICVKIKVSNSVFRELFHLLKKKKKKKKMIDKW